MWPSKVESETELRDEKHQFQCMEGSEVITAFDAVGLYPSISKKVAMKVCREAAENSVIEVKEMNLLEATRFLALTMSKQEIRKGGLTGLLPKRRKIPGMKIG